MTNRPIIPTRALLGAALKSRTSYEAIAASGVLAGLNDTPGDLYREIEAYYEKDQAAASCHAELIQAALEHLYTNPKHRTKARDFLGGLLAEDVSLPATGDYIRALRVERAGEALAAGILARRKDTGDLLAAYLECQQEPAAAESELSYLDAIKARVPKEGRIRVRLKALNERLRGGLLPGHSVIVAGRPNAGKSALVISLAVGFARDGRKVLFIGNEDPIGDLMVRAVSNVTGRGAEDIERDPDSAIDAAVREGLGHLVFRQLAPGTLPELERSVREVKPEILIVDQLRNISGKSENYTQRLDDNARGIRNLGLKYNAVTISVSQLGDAAEGKAQPGMGDLDNSKTGIPGACDVLLLMGITETLKNAGLRRLTLVKNKVSGIEDSFDVKINPSLSKVTSA